MVDPADTASGCRGEAADSAAIFDQDLSAAWLNLARVYAGTRFELERAIQRETGMGLAEGEIPFRLVSRQDRGCG